MHQQVKCIITEEKVCTVCKKKIGNRWVNSGTLKTKNVRELNVYIARENSSVREPFEECLNYKLHSLAGWLGVLQSFGQGICCKSLILLSTKEYKTPSETPKSSYFTTPEGIKSILILNFEKFKNTA